MQHSCWHSASAEKKAIPALKFVAAVGQNIHSLSSQAAPDFLLISASRLSLQDLCGPSQCDELASGTQPSSI